MKNNKKNIWVFSLEPLENRYTIEWFNHIPDLLRKKFKKHFDVHNITGQQMEFTPTSGAFLNFTDTNYWKSTQLSEFLKDYKSIAQKGDHFIFTDAWNPIILQLKYISDLEDLHWVFHGLWHAGSYDKYDFLGQLIDGPWVHTTEQSLFHALNYNYFATDFHIKIFENGVFEGKIPDYSKVIKTGWPMEYMKNTLKPYSKIKKKDLIVFPHRIASEKQVEIFRDLAESMPKYEFVVCQDKQLTKNEYHTIMAESKITFSASLQETLGISSCLEGPLLNSIPLVPGRLSYNEIFKGNGFENFTYLSIWTKNFTEYTTHKQLLIDRINDIMRNYNDCVNVLEVFKDDIIPKYFHCDKLISIINSFVE